MIVTLTANPSLDRTVELAGPLTRGQLHRAVAVTSEPGGKGVNVTRAVTAAGRPAKAVLPGREDDPLVQALRELRIDHHAVPVRGRLRVNLSVTEPDGTTTKLNEPGVRLDDAVRGELQRTLLAEAADARWVVLSGSLPPGAPDDWYAELVVALRAHRCSVAVDTSGAPLTALLAGERAAQPDLLKPNAEELAEATGRDPDELEADLALAAEAAGELVARGVGAVLATLGAAGALLVTADGSWRATPPRVTPRSTVGAGDSTLSGYVLADLDGAPPAERLRTAVAYGAAAVCLPGTTMPGPHDLDTAGVTVDALGAPQLSTSP
jgi:1-phosphofructokinase